MFRACRAVGFSVVLFAINLAVTGCSLSHVEPAAVSAAIPQISGRVHGGQQPVSGAAIQLYAANPTMLQGASTSLISSTVLTDAGGNFSITGDYTCPSGSSPVYLLATGGNPGLTGSVNNSGIALMAALGTCGSLTSSTFVSVNELTTVAAVESLAPFMTDAVHVGTSSSNPNGLVGAFAGANAMVSSSTGQLAPPSTGVTQPTALLNTLADITAACVNTSGGSSGDGTSCGKLFQYAGTGTSRDTVSALLGIVHNPAKNATQLYGLASASAPFQPTYPSAPTDFTAPLVIQLPKLTKSLPQGYFIVITADQNIWVYAVADSNSSGSYQYTTGSLMIYDTNGTLLHSYPTIPGGVNIPFGGYPDPFGNVWVLNSTQTVSKLGPDGLGISPVGGYPFPFKLPPNLEYSPGTAGEDISEITSDPSGNVWGIARGAGAGCYNEIGMSGTTIPAAGNFCGRNASNVVASAVSDGSGNIWMLGTSSVSKVSPAGDLVTNGVNTNGCFYFDGVVGDAGALNDALNMVYDRSQDHLWSIAPFSIGALRADGTQVFCGANGQNLPVIPIPQNGIPTKYLEAIDSTVDGAGNLWFATGGGAYNGSTFTPIGGLNELDANGNLLTPFNASAGVYGLTVSPTLQPGVSSGGVQGLGIDAYGNIWATNNSTYTLTKIPGLAVPKNYQ